MKIIVQKLPLDKNGDLIFDVDEARDIHNNGVAMLKRAVGVDVLTTFTDVESIDLSDKNTSTTKDDLEKVERAVFNAFGISYFSNWEKLKELSLYKKKEFCLTYALSPMFFFPNTFEPLLTKKNIFISLFDAHGINLISEYSLPYTLFKNSIINIFDFTCSNVKPKQFGKCMQLMDYIKNARVDDVNYQNFFYYYVPSFFLRYDCNNIDLFTSDFEEFYFQPSKEGLFPLLSFFKLFFLYLPFKDSFICTFIKHFVYNLSNSEENKKTNSTKNYIIILLNKLFDLNYSYSVSNFSQNKKAPIDYKEFKEQHYFQVLLSFENDLQYIPWVISLLWLKKLNIFVLYGFYDVIQQRPVIYDFNNILKCDEDSWNVLIKISGNSVINFFGF